MRQATVAKSMAAATAISAQGYDGARNDAARTSQPSPISMATRGMNVQARAENTLLATCLAAAAQGDLSALFDLGVASSTGSHDFPYDLIEAHKWFNLAAVSGHEEAHACRAEIAEEMTARDIAEAQRRAREWLSATIRRAA